MSPFLTCFPRLLSAKPFGWGHTRLSHIKRRRLIMPLVALVQKDHSAPATSYKIWCSALPSSSPLLLAFRLRTSECLYKNAQNKQTANKKGTHSSAFYYYQNLILGLRRLLPLQGLRFLLRGCRRRLLQGFLRLQPLLLFHRQGLLRLQGLSCPF